MVITLPKIKLLDTRLIDRIAAGEVIERPAAVVKELVENAIDAKASRVDVSVEEGGMTKIVIRDDGHGIEKEEISLAFERHATSKLSHDDLFAIDTFGFRGEAMPSVASISRVELITRTETAAHGWKIEVDGGRKSEVAACPAAKGTVITVSDLFFSTPARLKFLKSAATELSYVKDVFVRLSVANPEIHFTLKSENKTIHDFAPATFPERIAQAMGGEFFENSVAVLHERDNHKIEGIVSLPTYSRARNDSWHVYVNKRWVKDRALASLAGIAYQDTLARGRYPTAVLFLTVDSREVDVNVHPAKTEVRFRDMATVRKVVIDSIKRSLDAACHSAAPTYSHAASRNFTANKPIAFRTTFSPQNLPASARPLIEDARLSFKSSEPFESVKLDATAPVNDDYSATYPLGFAKAQLFETYIVAQTEDSLLIVDQHAAHERVTYEKLKKDSRVNSQTLLTPVYVDLSDREFETFKANAKLFEETGFVIDAYPPNAAVIHGAPAIEGLSDFETIFKDTLSDLETAGVAIAATEAVWEKLATRACHNSVRAGKALNLIEMNELLRQMEKTEKAGICNHGRPTYVKLDKKSLEKLFERS